MRNSKYFIEVDCFQRSEKGNAISGDVYLQKRCKNRIILVLSDGEGSGVKANVIASVIASMAINYTLQEEPVLRAAQAVVETFARGDKSDDAKQATFSIVDINENGAAKIIEFENPPSVVMRGKDILDVPRRKYIFEANSALELTLHITEFEAQPEDRIVLYTDGVTASGMGTRRMPKGWQERDIAQFLRNAVSSQGDVSARQLCRSVIGKAESNDLFAIKNDMSCACVYFRQPRKILVCSGPPFDGKRDGELAELVRTYPGTKIVCGGTTAQIIARELKREVSVSLKRDPSGLPPTSRMEGVDLVTEGVLTLGKVKVLLDALGNTEVSGKGTDARMARMLLEHDIIDFVVGTRINPVHQDPTLPVELELRRNVVKEIARSLESKFMKEVNLKFV